MCTQPHNISIIICIVLLWTDFTSWLKFAGRHITKLPICIYLFSQVLLGNSTIQVPKRLFQRLSTRRMSLFTQDLALLVFGRETLARSSLTGKGKKGETKDQLDPVKVDAIIGTDVFDTIVFHIRWQMYL